jgi:modification target Cys-rich repeat protein
MNRKLRGLFFTVPGIIIGVAGATSCDKLADAAGDLNKEICGECGTIANGDFSVSGDAQLDGFFQAVGNLQNATATVQGDFEGNILALANVYGVGQASFDASLTDKVIAAIKADVSANLQGGFNVVYKPPACQASVDVAVQAQAKCEVKGGCDAKVNPGHASVKCEGTCTGTCMGTCSGEASCTVTAPTVNCEGTCEGSCELSAAAMCDGTCHGKCNGTCSATDGNGQCQGSCTGGTCEGSCELKAAAKCTGTCHGSCHVDQGSAQCKGSVQCSGKCDADCSGSCEGSFEPPSASASCDASADCQAQAKAQAKASLECQPPRLDINYGFKAGVKADAQAEFTARLAQLKVRAGAIVQGAAKMTALVTGKVDGKVVFDPSPVAELTASLKGFANADAVAKFDIPKGRLLCVVPAFIEAGKALGDVATTTGNTVSAQAKFVTYITTGK